MRRPSLVRLRPVSMAAAVAVLISGSASIAHAGTFSDEGAFAFDSAAADSFDFEDGVPPPTSEEDEPMVRIRSDSALSGEWVVTVTPFDSVDARVTLPADKRSYRASIWVRGGDSVGYFVTAHDEQSRSAELVVLFPSGRMTSDGWVELTSDQIRFDGSRSAGVLGVFSPGGCEVDAMEIVPIDNLEGEVNPSCEGAADSSACDVGQVCYWSECRNVSGWVPPIPQHRDEATEYLANRLRFMFGPYLNRTLDMPASMAAIEAMKSADTPWEYWNNYMLAVRRLHDGHTATSGLFSFVIDNPKPINVCFLEGLADLSQAGAPSDGQYRDVVVSHVGPDHNLGLRAGDRLVSVDGLHPIAWSRALIAENWSSAAISNHTTFAEHASRLRASISRFAHEMAVIRCDAAGNCGAPETISISAIPPDEKDTPLDVWACDNRPLRHVPGAPVNHRGGFGEVYSGIVNESNASERIYGVEWESLSTTNGSDGVGANLSMALSGINAGGGNGAILDHRTGTGGTNAGSLLVWNWAVPPHPITLSMTRQRAEDEQPSKALGLSLFNNALQNDEVLIGGSNNATTIPVALLITQDVSASDWLPLGMKGAAPNIRIFGPYETNGAFSTRYQYSYWLGMTVVLATGDSILPDGQTQAGRGIAPDVVLLPKQSDLTMGKDTVFEAALDWVRQEIQP